jgi:hypothetical protein
MQQMWGINMSKVYLDDSILTGIANSIRTKTGESGIITPANMAAAIANISGGGGGGQYTVDYVYAKTDYWFPIMDYITDMDKVVAIITVVNEGSSEIYDVHLYTGTKLTNQTVRIDNAVYNNQTLYKLTTIMRDHAQSLDFLDLALWINERNGALWSLYKNSGTNGEYRNTSICRMNYTHHFIIQEE